jgi:hypothetical protein
VTGPKTPYELRWRSPMVAEMNVIQIHLAVDQYIAAVKRVHQEEPSAIEVIDFYGRDETLAHLSFACAEMLSAQTPGDSKRGFSGMPRHIRRRKLSGYLGHRNRCITKASTNPSALWRKTLGRVPIIGQGGCRLRMGRSLLDPGQASRLALSHKAFSQISQASGCTRARRDGRVSCPCGGQNRCRTAVRRKASCQDRELISKVSICW